MSDDEGEPIERRWNMAESDPKTDRPELSAISLSIGEHHIVLSANEIHKVLIHLDENTSREILGICGYDSLSAYSLYDENRVMIGRDRFPDEMFDRRLEVSSAEDPSSAPPLDARSQSPTLTPSPPSVPTAAEVAQNYYRRDAVLFS